MQLQAAHTKYKFRVTRRRTTNCPARLVVASPAEFLNEFEAPRDEMRGTLHTLCAGDRNSEVPRSERGVTVIYTSIRSPYVRGL